jgi:hypothetical protein
MWCTKNDAGDQDESGQAGDDGEGEETNVFGMVCLSRTSVLSVVAKMQI